MGGKMTDNELFKMLIQERIDILLTCLNKEQPTDTNRENDDIFKAEDIIDALPTAEKNLIQNYIDSLIEQLEKREIFLYKQGFLDGIKIMKKINKL